MRPRSSSGNRYEIPAFATHLKKFSGDDQRDGVLERHAEDRRYFYRFDDPMMQSFVILNGLAEGKISEKQLSEIRQAIKAAHR